MVKAVTCEVWRSTLWQEIDIIEALIIGPGHLMRCCKCQGRFRVHRLSDNGIEVFSSTVPP